MNVFMDEYFITTSKLQQTVPGDIINMYLGVDPGIKVNIKPVFKQDTTSGFLSKKILKLLTELQRLLTIRISMLQY
jgi:hypothetical protein